MYQIHYIKGLYKLILPILFIGIFGWYLENTHAVEIIYAKERVEVTPTPTPALECIWCGLEPHLDYVYEVFGHEEAERGLKMLTLCENKSLNINGRNWNSNGTWDYGLWQINSVHGYTEEQLSDPYTNTDVAYKIFQTRGWSAWTCSYVIDVKSFWQGGD